MNKRTLWLSLALFLLTGCVPDPQPAPVRKPTRPQLRGRLQPAAHIPQTRRVAPQRPSPRPTAHRKPRLRKANATASRPSSRPTRIRRGSIDLKPSSLPRKEARYARRMIAMGAGRRNQLTPVYHAKKIKPHPLARQICQAMHTLPARRKASCCKEKNIGYVSTQECIRNLSIALKIGAVQLRQEKVKACLAALQRVHQGCGWVGMWTPSTPSACLNLFVGKLPLNKICRSNLECKDGLHCFGLGTVSPGRCYPPLPTGSRCGTGVDTLATYTRQNNIERRHPMCRKGYCARYRCKPHHKAGAPCKANVQCEPGHYCNGTRCIKGKTAPPGSACTGRCAPGYRCLQRKCTRLKEQGERCNSDLECRGGCLPVPGKSHKECGMRCRPPIFDRR